MSGHDREERVARSEKLDCNLIKFVWPNRVHFAITAKLRASNLQLKLQECDWPECFRRLLGKISNSLLSFFNSTHMVWLVSYPFPHVTYPSLWYAKLKDVAVHWRWFRPGLGALWAGPNVSLARPCAWSDAWSFEYISISWLSSFVKLKAMPSNFWPGNRWAHPPPKKKRQETPNSVGAWEDDVW